MGTFKFLTLSMGSGWMSGHVAIDEYRTYPDKKDGQNIILNPDTDCFEEFSSEIDRLIAELESIRSRAKRQFLHEERRVRTAIEERRASRLV